MAPCAQGIQDVEDAAPLPSIPNFKVLAQLGKGAYGQVFKAQRITDGLLYAVKKVDVGAYAANEVRLLRSIQHPNVISCIEWRLIGNQLYIVMELAPFTDLGRYIKKFSVDQKAFPEQVVWRLLLQVTRGLVALHAKKVVHRDIKPENLLLFENDMLKIGDLGSAKDLTHCQSTRTAAGTYEYMAPEIWAARSYSFSCDMWSLGCVLYEMMTLRKAMPSRNFKELGQQVCRGQFIPIPHGDYSAELIGLVDSLLSVCPHDRPTAEQLLNQRASREWMYILSTLTSGPPPHNALSSPMQSTTINVPHDPRQLSKVLPATVYPSHSANDLAAPPQAPARQAGPPQNGTQPGPGDAPESTARGPAPSSMSRPDLQGHRPWPRVRDRSPSHLPEHQSQGRSPRPKAASPKPMTPSPRPRPATPFPRPPASYPPNLRVRMVNPVKPGPEAGAGVVEVPSCKLWATPRLFLTPPPARDGDCSSPDSEELELLQKDGSHWAGITSHSNPAGAETAGVDAAQQRW